MINIEKFADKLNHHDLIVIEQALIDQYDVKMKLYRSLQKELLNFPSLPDCSDDERSFILSRMKLCCKVFDEMVEIKSVLSVYDDVRSDDYKNKDF